MAQDVKPLAVESTFGIDELFFSTTDRKGVIRAGNDVFVRVSQWDEDELIGRPHNIIRHPDMPRAVFWLLWEYILNGKPIAAYVKNMAKSGAYYWVIATVVPAGDGFLSVRMKPSTAFHDVVKPVYAELHELESRIERAGGSRKEAIAASAARLGEILNGAGFADYDAFMHTFLPAELRSRAAAIGMRAEQPANGASPLAQLQTGLSMIGTGLDRLFANIESYAAANETLSGRMSFVTSLAREVRLSSVNGVMAASHLSHRGHTLGVVADLMSRCAERVNTSVADLTEELKPTVAILGELSFSICLAKIQVDLAEYFVSELRTERDMDEHAAERRREGVGDIIECLGGEVSRLLRALRGLDGRLRGVASGVERLESGVRELGVLNVMGRVEMAEVPEAEGFTALFDAMRQRLETAEVEMDALRGAAHAGRAGASSADRRLLRDGLERAARAGEEVCARELTTT